LPRWSPYRPIANGTTSREPHFERLIYLKVGGTPPGWGMSNDYRIVLLHRQAVADHADQLIADAREQINRGRFAGAA